MVCTACRPAFDSKMLASAMINWFGKKPKYPAGHCQFCGYDLRGCVNDTCPECGKWRFAWVEAKCDRCHRTAVFTREEAGRIQACPSCENAIDVPMPTAPGNGSVDSITGTRFSIIGFVTVTILVAIPSMLVFVILFVGLFRLIGVREFNWAIVLVPAAASLALGAWLGIRNCYR